MALPNILILANNKKGFTMIEILIVIAIMVAILSLGLFISLDFYRRYIFASEQNILISTLQKARSQSLNNIDQVRHGIHFQAFPLQYIIFECPAANPQCNNYPGPSNSDNIITPSNNISFASDALSLPFDIIFDQLSGNCLNCSGQITIQLSNKTKTYTIKINDEGGIDWQ